MNKETLEQEAERLYPYSEKGELKSLATENQIAGLQRSAHITAARQYMDTIEKLRAALTKIEGIARRFGNGPDPEKDIEQIETIATSALK